MASKQGTPMNKDQQFGDPVPRNQFKGANGAAGNGTSMPSDLQMGDKQPDGKFKDQSPGGGIGTAKRTNFPTGHVVHEAPIRKTKTQP